MTVEEWEKDFKSFVNELQMPRDDYKGIMEYIDDAISLLKEQEHKDKMFRALEDDWKRLKALLKEQPEIVRCRDCKHRPTQTEPPKTYGFSIEFPEGSKCPCQCDDGFYSWYPNDDWFCADGERKVEKAE